MSAIDEIAALFETEGAQSYLGEAVTQAEHMLQAGWLAECAGADEALVAAALLHDVGHFSGAAVTGNDLMSGRDNHHSDTGSAWLGQWFGPDVTEPVRLHVAAKRYLCAVEPGYFDQLSPASVYTLSVQGGAMSESEAWSFETSAHAADAVTLRRFDERAKDPDSRAPGFEHFREMLERLMRE
ncbi:MAG: phosphonate degradation HD-domain oxygenase [Acidimicrobiales bacterium]